MIDRFTKDRFEAALPRIGKQNPLWSEVGLRDGEYCYIVPINPGILVYIRSSVRSDGLAAESAKDSIRCWLAMDDKGTTLSSKDTRWVTRVSGWERRLLETLRTLWRIGRQLAKVGSCPRCQARPRALKVKKPGPNQGRWFAACPNCANGFLTWLTTPTSTKEAA